jgi:hypothetical protein
MLQGHIATFLKSNLKLETFSIGMMETAARF